MKLVRDVSTKTGNDILSKAWYIHQGSKYLIKGNTKNNLEPYNEVIACKIGRLLNLPYGLYGKSKRKVTMLEFINWASERCFPEEREGSEQLLKELGLEKYDGWEIVKKINGILEQDYYWIDFGKGIHYPAYREE